MHDAAHKYRVVRKFTPKTTSPNRARREYGFTGQEGKERSGEGRKGDEAKEREIKERKPDQ